MHCSHHNTLSCFHFTTLDMTLNNTTPHDTILGPYSEDFYLRSSRTTVYTAVHTVGLPSWRVIGLRRASAILQAPG